MAKRKSKEDYLYRIVRFEHLIQMFENEELHLSNPKDWDDPYETRLRHKAFDAVSAQCWCKHSVSDAMWRIYSPHQLGVRIKTTRQILIRQLDAQLGEMQRFAYRVADVAYKPQDTINKSLLRLEKKLYSTSNGVLSPLFWKRRAFSHEAEVRVVVFDREADEETPYMRFRIDPHELVKTVLVDPRAPDEIVHLYEHYLRSKLRFKGRVGKSELYSRRPLHPE